MAIAILGLAANGNKKVTTEGIAFAGPSRCWPIALSLLALFLAPVISMCQPLPSPIIWRPIGPHDIPGASDSVSSGKLQALAVYYNNPGIMYSGGGRGPGTEGPPSQAGAFKTTDGGITWAPINSGLADSMVNTLWVDQGNQNLVLAGTENTGIFKSADGGQTWILAGKVGATSVITSGNGNLLAATAAGIAQSTDLGTTWSVIQPTGSVVRALAASNGGPIVAGLENGTLMIRSTPTAAWQIASNPGRTVWAVASDPVDTRVAYAVLGYFPGTLMVTRDAGATWARASLPSDFPAQALSVGSVPPAVYAATGNPGALFSTSDGGLTWVTIPVPQEGTWDNRAIYPLPQEGHVILGSDQGLYKTVDGGKTWASISGSIYSSILFSAAVSGSVILTALQDFSPILSFDRGNTWLQPVWDHPTRGPIGEYGAVVINPINPSYSYAYTGFGYQYSTDGCRTFSYSNAPGSIQTQLAAANNVAVDPTLGSTVYAASQHGVFKSLDWGVTMSPTNWGLTQATAIAVKPSDSNTIFVGTVSGLYRTQNGGTTWTKLNLAGALGNPNAIAIDPANPNLVLVGLSFGGPKVGNILKSNDGGTTFQLANAGLSSTSQICCGVDVLSVRFGPDSQVALATSTGIYISTDLGDHWQSANANAAPTYFTDVAWDSGYLYAATYGQGLLQAAVPRQVQVTGGPVQFRNTIGLSAPTGSEVLQVTSVDPGLTFTVSASRGSNAACGQWLTVNPASGTTAGTTSTVSVTLSYSVAGLSPSSDLTCIGSVAFTTSSGSTITIPVTLNILAQGNQGAFSTYYFPHFALGGGWQTVLTYVNYSPQSITCQTRFLSDTGAPLPVPFGGVATASRIDKVPAGGEIHLLSTADPTAAGGWAQGQCTAPVKASMLFRLFNGKTAIGEAGVNAMTAPATRFVTFADSKTGVTYANPSSAVAVVTIAALNALGVSLASKTITLQPGSHGAANLGPLLGLSSFTGSVQITSTVPIVSLSLNAEAFPAFSSLPPGDLSSSVTTYYFPHFALGGGWQTVLTMVNDSSENVTCATSFLSDAGGSLTVSFGGGASSTRTDTLPPGGEIHDQSQADPKSSTVGGWAESRCTGPVKASMLFRLFNAGVATAEAGVNASTAPANKFVTFAETRTGLAYANPSSTTATLRITALNASGESLGTTTINLPPAAHGATNLGPLLGLSSFTGSVQITSTVPIVSLSLNAEAFPAFSSLPPGDLDASTVLSTGQL